MGREFAMHFLWQPCAWGSYNTSLCPDIFLYLAELRDYHWFRCRGTSQFAHLENIFWWTCNSADFDMFWWDYITLFWLENQTYIACELQRKGQEMNVKCSARCDVPMIPMQSPVLSEMVRNREKNALNFLNSSHGGAVCGKSFSGSMQQQVASANSETSEPSKSWKSWKSSTSRPFPEAVTLSGKESWAQMSRESAHSCAAQAST